MSYECERVRTEYRMLKNQLEGQEREIDRLNKEREGADDERKSEINDRIRLIREGLPGLRDQVSAKQQELEDCERSV